MFTGWKRVWFLAVGQVSVGLAVLGVFLPLLPTTPFLLLAAYCFLRSSPASYHWLVTHPLLGQFLKDWQLHRAIRRSVKATASITIICLAGATWWLTPNSVLRCLTLLGSAIGLIVILRLPTIPRPETVQSQHQQSNGKAGLAPNPARTLY